MFVRGNRQNYDDWACPGWTFEDVLPSFKRFEDWEDGATAIRGAGGPVKVTRQKDLTPASQAFIEALAATAGADDRAVVAPDLRVRGIDGLRVADASIMPAIPGGNTNAPAMMIGEHAAQLIAAGS